MEAQRRDRHAYFPFIDGIRALAVLAVVVYHLNGAWLPGGFTGVDVFFVVSGFVVSASVGQHERGALHRFAIYFLHRRILRIAPALVVCLLGASLAAALFIPEAWLSDNSETTARYAFFGLSNFVLAQNANSYFSPISEFNPFTHTWSLGVEEQFYLVFPWAFWLWTRGGRSRWAAVSLFVVGALGSMIYAWLKQPVAPLSAFYLLPARFWELAAGVLLYQGMALAGHRFDIQDAEPPASWREGLGWIGLVMVVVGLVTATTTSFPLPYALWPVAGTVLLLGALHRQPMSSPLVRILCLRPVRFVGAISYSLYLWHWPVFVLFRWTVGLEGIGERAAALGLAFVLAVVSWRFVEMPVRRSLTLRRFPRLALIAGGVLVLGLGAHVSHWLDKHQPKISLSVVARHAGDWYPSALSSKKAPLACGVGAPSITPVGEGIRVTYTRATCEKPRSAPDVYAIGDSHAMAFGSLFANYVRDTGAQVTLYNNGGCPLLDFKPAGPPSPRCAASTEAALSDLIPRLKAGDVVFLPSLRMPRLVDQWIRYDHDAVISQWLSVEADSQRSQKVTEARPVLGKLSATGASIVLEAPNLVLNAPAYRCADTWTRTNPICSLGTSVDRAEMERLRAPALAAEFAAITEVPRTRLFDPFELFCPAGRTCDGYRDGRPLFFDGDHVSAYGNEVMLPAFTDAMRRAVSGTDTNPSPALP